MHLTKTDDAQRLELFKQGLSDAEMAERLNITPKGVAGWRRKAGLARMPSRPMYGKIDKPTGTDMERALTPKQCDAMRDFLGRMINTADSYPDKYFDVLAYMQEYRKAGLVWGENTGTPA